MAITTVNDKLALMSWMQPYQLPLPISADGLGQADIQQFLWGYPGILWGPFVPPVLPASEVWQQIFHIRRRVSQTFQR